MSMQRGEDELYGIHVDGEPSGVRGLKVGRRHNDPESESYALPAQISEAAEVERDRADLEPYADHEKSLQSDDAEARAYMEVWDWYQCAYNATSHRRMVDSVEEKIHQLLCSILGEPVSFGGPDEPNFSQTIWKVGQERARLLSMVEEQGRTNLNLAENLNTALGYMQALRDVAEWVGATTVAKDPQELVEAIKASVANPRKRDSYQ